MKLHALLASASAVSLAPALALAKAPADDATEAHDGRGLRGAPATDGEGDGPSRRLGVFDDLPAVGPAAGEGRRLSGRVIIKRKSREKLREQGKSEEEIDEMRGRAMDEIRGLGVVYKSGPGLDFQVIDVGLGAEEGFIRGKMNGPDADMYDYMEPDYIVSPTLTPNDQYLYLSWQHDNMQSRLAWDLNTGSPSVVVAICDTGLDMDHPDLAGNKVEGYNADTQKMETEGGNVSWQVSGSSHGTMCAGCAAAMGNNGIGTVGVGLNLKHRPMQVSNAALGGNAYSSTLAHCAQKACDLGDKVVSVSYSGVETLSRRSAATYCKQRGSLMFNAAGNDNRDITGYDADADDLIVVGATDQNDARSTFSAYGSFVDIMGPGTNVVSTGVNTDTGASGYYYVSGTSFSCPLAAGLAALIWSAAPLLTPDEVEQVIKESADDLGIAGYDNTFAHGRINSYQALLHLLVVGGPPATSSPTSSPTTASPTKSPTLSPTGSPTTSSPTGSPTTSSPTSSPTTSSPTGSPTTSSPTKSPTTSPTGSPTTSPPTKSPTTSPTKSPTPSPQCSDFTKGGDCKNAFDGGVCRWIGKENKCVPV